MDSKGNGKGTPLKETFNSFKSSDRFEGILVDFDGVICRTSVDTTAEFVHSFLSKKQKVLEFDFVRNFIKATIAFPSPLVAKPLFYAIGLTDSDLKEFADEMHAFNSEAGNFPIENEFYEFMSYCDSIDLPMKVFSMSTLARLRHIRGLKAKHVPTMAKPRSKMNSNTFLQMAAANSINLDKWIYVDDSPPALLTGKLVGLHTIFMRGDLFTKEDASHYREYIDQEVNSFFELQQTITQLLGIKTIEHVIS